MTFNPSLKVGKTGLQASAKKASVLLRFSDDDLSVADVADNELLDGVDVIRSSQAR